jgi:hypothetical protein
MTAMLRIFSVENAFIDGKISFKGWNYRKFKNAELLGSRLMPE